MSDARIAFMMAATVAFTLPAAAQEQLKRQTTEIKYEKDKKVKYTIVPPKAGMKVSVPVLLALPPGPGSAEMVNVALTTWEKETFTRGWMLIVPEVLGPDLQAEAKAMIPAILESVAKNHSIDTKRVALAGASNGGLGAFYAAVACPGAVKSILAMPGGWSEDMEALSVLKSKKVRILVGEKDDEGWRKMAESTCEALKKIGAECELEVLAGQGHVLKIEPKKLFDWIEKATAK